MLSTSSSFWRDNRVALPLGALAVALAALVRFVIPYEREISSVWMLLVKVTPQLAALACVAWLDVAWARRLRLHLVALPAIFLGFLCYFVPATFMTALDMVDGTAEFEDLYLHVVVFVPFIMIGLALAYRVGGGSREGVLRVGAAMTILQLSGLEDLVAVMLNSRLDGIPEVWDWAHHITVRLGHVATRNEAYAFIAVHVVLAVLALAVPRRLFAALGRRLRPGRRPAG
ncbi:hypothetical protein LDL08_09820 [Nonomuraea glycinis]|uniref:Uncharacterized protein n=1 Tax=Nonomuraea glycinis TaxID=2047744 RepID=A0A918A7C8_9ACTN|nr:hypothetical protein [Nonomuraea glycinis]MCA2176479.1 hypothetical protein [Nonomuraea glycinis]GGP07080.1 hypothetical protein GCM10012278_33420 [Nonomuraea glycinis]